MTECQTFVDLEKKEEDGNAWENACEGGEIRGRGGRLVDWAYERGTMVARMRTRARVDEGELIRDTYNAFRWRDRPWRDEDGDGR